MECAKLERYSWWKALLDLVSVGKDPAFVPQKELNEWYQKAVDLFISKAHFYRHIAIEVIVGGSRVTEIFRNLKMGNSFSRPLLNDVR